MAPRVLRNELGVEGQKPWYEKAKAADAAYDAGNLEPLGEQPAGSADSVALRAVMDLQPRVDVLAARDDPMVVLNNARGLRLERKR